MAISLRRLVFSRLGFIGVLTALGIYFLLNLPSYVNFGIDLVGGTYITLQVQTDKAYESRLAQDIQTALATIPQDEQARVIKRSVTGSKAQILFADETAAQSFSRVISEQFLGLVVEGVSADAVTIGLSEAEQRHISSTAVERNIQALKNRLDQFGVGEILIAPKGDDMIVIELPNVQDPQAAKRLIGKPSMLEIKPVLEWAATQDELLERYAGVLPDETEALAYPDAESWVLVPRRAELTGEYLKDAFMGYGGELVQSPVVFFQLTPAGRKIFYDLTSENVGNHVAMIIDGVVITAPVVNQPIQLNNDSAYIQGKFTVKSAQELAMMLRSGAFVAPVSFEEERTIGPSLGAEAIRQGLMACILALVLLFFFSIGFYKVSGLLAFTVLLYNLMFILVLLSVFGATLTLPGIVGMILTVGMAIDASILIYERIKEELARGVFFKQAVATGFAGAMSVILDANITHLIVSLVLYWLGSGPLQGFAVTMIIGIVSTLITGLWLLRYFFSIAFDMFHKRQISI